MSKIKELPEFERPREKAKQLGFENLSDAEILSLIIGSGCKGTNAIDVANNLLRNSRGLYYLFSYHYQDFINEIGIGEIGALRLAAVFELAKRYKIKASYNEILPINSELIYKRYQPRLIGYTQEVLIVVILNKQHRILHEETLFKGTDKNVDASITEILRCIIIHHGYYFYIIHNHPIGLPKPSNNDVFMTEELAKDAIRMHIKLVDHIIISSSGYYSFLNKKANESEEEF